MKKLLVIFFSMFSLIALSQKKVAIYVMGENAGVNKVFGSKLVSAIARSEKYTAIERTSAFLAELSKEQKYQRTGAVDDDEISRLGKQFGVEYVCVADISDVFGEKFISARLIDVETAEVINTYDVGGAMDNMDSCLRMAEKIAVNLAKGSFKEQIEDAAKEEIQKKEQEKAKLEAEVRMYGYYEETAFGVNMKMVFVNGGDFMMGCTSEQGDDCNSDETKVRHITLDDFYIGMMEITQSQWEKVMGTTIQQQGAKWEGTWLWGVSGSHPMYYITWSEAKEFCRRLSLETNRTYTLPTEAQWEYAARGGIKAETTKYSGNDVVSKVAWFSKNSDGESHTCGTKSANELGIYDMSGNIAEWCEDWYIKSYIDEDISNPIGSTSGTYKVVRGGSFVDGSDNCRISARGYTAPNDEGFSFIGFRVVCIP